MKRKWMWALGLLAVLCLIAVPVSAAVMQAMTVTSDIEPVLANVGSYYGVCPQPYTNTFYAQGRNWLFYLTEGEASDLVYTSAEPGEEFDSPTTVAEDCGLYAVEFSVWYDSDTGYVHYARHDMAADPDEVVYRMGTPSSDGTITWAAVEQTVSTVPSDLLTWRTTVTVDENGYPWVAWIDSDNVTEDRGVVFVRGSATNDGTWTTNATRSSDNISFGINHHAWFVQLTPVGTEADVVELEWSSSNTSDDNCGLYARQFHMDTNWGDTEIVAAEGYMSFDRPDGFDFYDLGSSMWAVYTNNLGDVMCRARSSIQTWDECAAAEAIKEGDAISLPTISGYENVGLGEDLLCIVNLDYDTLYYSIHSFGDDIDEWSTFVAIWSAGSDNITRHNAAYKYTSPIGFSWQYTDVSDTPDSDTIMFWWLDQDEGLGYYYSADDAIADNAVWNVVGILPYVFLSITLVMSIAFMVGGAPIAGLILLVITMVIGIVGTGLIQGLIP